MIEGTHQWDTQHKCLPPPQIMSCLHILHFVTPSRPSVSVNNTNISIYSYKYCIITSFTYFILYYVGTICATLLLHFGHVCCSSDLMIDAMQLSHELYHKFDLFSTFSIFPFKIYFVSCRKETKICDNAMNMTYLYILQPWTTNLFCK